MLNKKCSSYHLKHFITQKKIIGLMVKTLADFQLVVEMFTAPLRGGAAKLWENTMTNFSLFTYFKYDPQL